MLSAVSAIPFEVGEKSAELVKEKGIGGGGVDVVLFVVCDVLGVGSGGGLCKLQECWHKHGLMYCPSLF